MWIHPLKLLTLVLTTGKSCWETRDLLLHNYNRDLGSLKEPACPGRGCWPWNPQQGPAQYSLVDLVGKAPAVTGVTVTMPCVDEAILQGLADVLGRQASHGSHHIAREGPHTQRPRVLPTPPVILSPAQQR